MLVIIRFYAAQRSILQGSLGLIVAGFLSDFWSEFAS